jgi:hypothetical protein
VVDQTEVEAEMLLSGTKDKLDLNASLPNVWLPQAQKVPQEPKVNEVIQVSTATPVSKDPWALLAHKVNLACKVDEELAVLEANKEPQVSTA